MRASYRRLDCRNGVYKRQLKGLAVPSAEEVDDAMDTDADADLPEAPSGKDAKGNRKKAAPASTPKPKPRARQARTLSTSSRSSPTSDHDFDAGQIYAPEMDEPDDQVFDAGQIYVPQDSDDGMPMTPPSYGTPTHSRDTSFGSAAAVQGMASLNLDASPTKRPAAEEMSPSEASPGKRRKKPIYIDVSD